MNLEILPRQVKHELPPIVVSSRACTYNVSFITPEVPVSLPVARGDSGTLPA